MTNYPPLLVSVVIEWPQIESSWVLHDPAIDDMDDSCLVWGINKWNHMCFSYSEPNSFISFIKVRNS